LVSIRELRSQDVAKKSFRPLKACRPDDWSALSDSSSLAGLRYCGTLDELDEAALIMILTSERTR